MGEKTKIWISWGTAIMTLILAAKTSWELYTLVWNIGKTPQENLRVVLIWFILFVLFALIAIGVRELELQRIKNARPIIKLKDFGFQIKTWVDLPPSVCAYIDVSNEPRKNSINDVNSYGVYPTITWIDEHGEITDKNNGRWFIPNEDQQGAIPLLMVDLDANGLPRRLHFTYSISENNLLQSFWRTNNNKIEAKIRGSNKYDITISLRDNKTTETEFYFRIMPISIETWPLKALRLERLSKKNGNVIEVKKFDFNDLFKFTNDYRPPLWN